MKIIHISDLHFGYHQTHIVNHFLNDMALINPDIIIISGDLTHRGTDEQYQLLSRFLKELPGKIFTVPGNHDIPFYNPFTRLINPFANYSSYVSKDLEPAFQFNYLRLLGVNSVNPYVVKDGKLSSSTLAHIKQYFENEFQGINLLFFHHNFSQIEGMHKPLHNSQAFLHYLKNSPIHIVCTGHLHYANTLFIEKYSRQNCLVLHAGTLSCKRSRDGISSYYFIEINPPICTIEWRTFKLEGFAESKKFDVNF